MTIGISKRSTTDVSFAEQLPDPRSESITRDSVFLDGDSSVDRKPQLPPEYTGRTLTSEFLKAEELLSREEEAWTLHQQYLAKDLLHGLLTLEQSAQVSQLREVLSSMEYSCTVLAIEDATAKENGRRLLKLDRDGFFVALSHTHDSSTSNTNERVRDEKPISNLLSVVLPSFRLRPNDLFPFAAAGADFVRISEVLGKHIQAANGSNNQDGSPNHSQQLLELLKPLNLAPSLYTPRSAI